MLQSGSCLCREIRFEVEGPLADPTHCHCSMCRKFHGAAFGSYCTVRRERLRMIAGEPALVSYASSEGVRRGFCGKCGASLFFDDAKEPHHIGIALGVFDGDQDVRPWAHIFDADRIHWVSVRDGLPRFPQSYTHEDYLAHHRAHGPLTGAEAIAFISTTDGARARGFYEGKLGLRVVSDDPFALVLDAGGTTVRMTKVEKLIRAPYTVLGWSVPDARETAESLTARGITFLRYDFFEQDELGIWTSPSGAKVAWFHDPDENVLSISEER